MDFSYQCNKVDFHRNIVLQVLNNLFDNVCNVSLPLIVSIETCKEV